ncbi:MAG: PrgI family protein [bacterium]
MQFVVPQFIDVEDKVIGPISVRQFVILLSGVGLIFFSYELIYRLNNNFWFFLFSAIILAVITIVLAFVRVNGRPFHLFLLNLIITIREPRLRIWNKQVSTSELRKKDLDITITTPDIKKKVLTKSRLAALSLVVDTGGAYHAPDEGELTPDIKIQRQSEKLSDNNNGE